MKKLIFDVFYDEEKGTAKAAAVEFNAFIDEQASAEYTDVSKIASEYIPGQFYKRELPAIMSLLEHQIGIEKLRKEYDVLIVDGLYKLGENHPGLGEHLKNCLQNTYGIDIEVIGIAKTHFEGCENVADEVFRGETATRPLWVNGSSNKNYKLLVENMNGKYRVPTLVKLVDSLCRAVDDEDEG
jgi:deoxyinosine 3'endonuclease (endonuclease V)